MAASKNTDEKEKWEAGGMGRELGGGPKEMRRRSENVGSAEKVIRLTLAARDGDDSRDFRRRKPFWKCPLLEVLGERTAGEGGGGLG